MADMVKVLNKRFKDENATGIGKRKKDEIKGQLDKYKTYLKEGTILEVVPNYGESVSGDLLYINEDAICFKIPFSEIKSLEPSYEPKLSESLVDVPLNVRIKEIKDDGLIILSLSDNKGKNISNKIKEGKKWDESKGEALERSLLKRLTKNEGEFKRSQYPVVYAYVTLVKKDAIYVDILKTGVVGKITRLYFRSQYTRDLTYFVKEGDVLQAQVCGYLTLKGTDKHMFLLSTRRYVPDSWNIIKKLHSDHELLVGECIFLTCVEKPKDKSYFWGISSVAPGIEIMCDYTKKFSRSIVTEGETYKTIIDRLNIKEKKFRVKPIAKSVNSRDLKVIDDE